MTNETRTPAIETTTGVTYITLAFANGQELTVDLGTLSADIITQATLHGLKQKLVDAAAISRNPDTGRSATIDDKYNAVLEVYNRLLAGQWNKARGDGTGAGAGGLLFRALCELYSDKTPDAIRTFLDKKDAKEKAALRALPKVAAIIETLRAAKLAKSGDVDTDALLGELED